MKVAEGQKKNNTQQRRLALINGNIQNDIRNILLYPNVPSQINSI